MRAIKSSPPLMHIVATMIVFFALSFIPCFLLYAKSITELSFVVLFSVSILAAFLIVFSKNIETLSLKELSVKMHKLESENEDLKLLTTAWLKSEYVLNKGRSNWDVSQAHVELSKKYLEPIAHLVDENLKALVDSDIKNALAAQP